MGKSLIKKVLMSAETKRFRGRIFLFENYDIRIARISSRARRLAPILQKALRSQRDQRDKGSGQWRPQSQRLRRLVV